MKIYTTSFQLCNDDGSYLNSVDYFGQAMGVWGHPGVDGKRILKLLTDGTFLWFMSFKDVAVMEMYLQNNKALEVVADGKELVGRYKAHAKGDGS